MNKQKLSIERIVEKEIKRAGWLDASVLLFVIFQKD